jgi:hypothetical protein
VMAETCGIPGYRYAIIAHPVSSNSQDELRKKAEEVVHQSLELLTLRPSIPSNLESIDGLAS